MSTPERIAGQIASVLQSTREVSIAWDSLAEGERRRLMVSWASLIFTDPDAAPDLIVEDICNHANLKAAWQRLGYAGQRGQTLIVHKLVGELRGDQTGARTEDVNRQETP